MSTNFSISSTVQKLILKIATFVKLSLTRVVFYNHFESNDISLRTAAFKGKKLKTIQTEKNHICQVKYNYCDSNTKVPDW